MITIQHTALYFLALHEARKGNLERMMEEFECEIPYVVLPDGIRALIGPRQVSHFEKTPDGTDVSWIKFPNEKTLKELTKENVTTMVSYSMADGYRPCVIGEETDIATFDRKNLGHKHYHALRIHLFQDCILDAVLREELIKHDQRFKDRFVVRHNQSMVMDGKELRRQVADFERIGFIKLAGIVFERTGVLLDRAWFEAHVYPALLKAYPEELANNTYKYMVLSDSVNERIQNHQFELTDEDRELVSMAFDLDTVLDDMYAQAYYYTKREL